MPPHRIRAVLGLHAISEFKNKNTVNDNTIDGPFESAYEIEFRNIIVHPKYECKRPDNDIGKDTSLFNKDTSFFNKVTIILINFE